MVFKCPPGTKKQFRFKKGTDIRLGGCAKKGKFVKIKEVTKIKRKKKRK